MVLLLQAENPESVLSIEKLDDIAFETDGDAWELLQTKHHVSHTASLTDSSTDLWKTLRVWSVAAANGTIDVEATVLSLVTTAEAAADSAAALLRPGPGRDVARALGKLRQAGSASTSETVQTAFQAFQALTPAQQEDMVSQIRVLDKAPGILRARELLETRMLGISPNQSIPPPGSTRPPLAANIRHALFYCFQHQTEIAINQALFHRQQEQAADYLIQAVRDTLPYFLGAIQENELALEEQLAMARRQLRQLEAEQRQRGQIQGAGVAKAYALVQEAVTVGVLPDQNLPNTMPELRALMEETMRWAPGQSAFSGSDLLGQLQDETDALKEERTRLLEAVRAARAMSGESQGFADEAKIQAERLECIGLFDEIGTGHEACPTCAQHLSVPTPQAEAIRGALDQLSKSLTGAERERPNLQEYIGKTNRELVQVVEKIEEKETSINSLLNEQQAAQRIRDLNSRRSKVVGRVSLYLESIPAEDGFDDLAQRIADAKRRVDRLEGQLDPTEKARRLASILNRLSLKMSEWSRFLQMEFQEYAVLLDIQAATVMIDLPNRPELLSRIGSGENWVGYHLIAHLALHRHFRQNRRPVPGFLFLDQPTQVYFPPERDPETEGNVGALNDDDQQKVARMYELIFLAVKELYPDFQVIVTDHADLRSSDDFQSAVVERWRGVGNGLIPSDWQ